MANGLCFYVASNVVLSVLCVFVLHVLKSTQACICQVYSIAWVSWVLSLTNGELFLFLSPLYVYLSIVIHSFDGDNSLNFIQYWLYSMFHPCKLFV